MSFFRNIDVKAPHIQQLQYELQLELANRGYSAQEDPVMAEYIVVMLANQKTPDQITEEMNDLIGSEYDPSFTDWIYNATQTCLDNHAAATAAQASSSADASASTSNAIGNFSARTRTRQKRSRSPQASGSAPRAREERRSISPMQSSARRANDQRRSRSRSPPSEASASRRPDRMSRGYSSNEAWRNSISLRSGDESPFDGEAFWRSKAEERRRDPPPPAINRSGGPSETRIFNAAYGQALRNGNSGRELFPDSDEPLPPYQASAGVSIFGRAGIPDPRAAEFVPSSAAAQREVIDLASPSASEPVAQPSSIFARIDPMLPDNRPLPAAAPEATAHSSNFPTQPTETSICRWNVGCTNPMCPYSHASPANTGPNGDPNALVLSQQNCRYGARCINKDCTRSHVSPAVARIQARSAAPVSFAPVAPPAPAAAPTTTTLSMDAALPSQSSSRPCRFGAACTRADCFFSHPPTRSVNGAGTASSTPCRFGLGCTRPDCYFTHPLGQRAANSAGTSNRLQVFAQADDEMETIIPGAAERDGSETVRSSPASVVVAGGGAVSLSA